MTFSSHTFSKDLKSDNLLIDGNYNCKICDFGLTRYIDHDGHMTACGTPYWTAPEVIFTPPLSFFIAPILLFLSHLWPCPISSLPFQYRLFDKRHSTIKQMYTPMELFSGHSHVLKTPSVTYHLIFMPTLLFYLLICHAHLLLFTYTLACVGSF
jgi:serine/threonine protein kinase